MFDKHLLNVYQIFRKTQTSSIYVRQTFGMSVCQMYGCVQSLNLLKEMYAGSNQ